MQSARHSGTPRRPAAQERAQPARGGGLDPQLRGGGLRRGAAALGLAALLAGCSPGGSGGDAPRLMNLDRVGSGPDEFAIVPTRPLEMPASFAELPPPAPAGRNRADPEPRAEAVAALGGNPALLGAAAVPAADAGLVARAGRFGVETGIRDRLAAEDLEFRRRNQGRFLERLFNVNVYFRAYAPMALDRHAELERWRAAGVRTPAAPPDTRRD